MSLEQSMSALARANEIRVGRAQIKRDLKAGETTLGAALSNPSTQSAPVIELLLALRWIGDSKAKRMMAECEISPYRTIGDLTDRQRKLLLAHPRTRKSR